MSSSSSKCSATESAQLELALGLGLLSLPQGGWEGRWEGWPACSRSQSRMRLTRPSPLSAMLRCSSPNALDRNRRTSSPGAGCVPSTGESVAARDIDEEWWYDELLLCRGREGKRWNASEVLGRCERGGTNAQGSRKTGLEPNRHGPRALGRGDFVPNACQPLRDGGGARGVLLTELSLRAFLPRRHLSTSHLSAGRSEAKSLYDGLRVLPARCRLLAVRHLSVVYCREAGSGDDAE